MEAAGRVTLPLLLMFAEMWTCRQRHLEIWKENSASMKTSNNKSADILISRPLCCLSLEALTTRHRLILVLVVVDSPTM
jgi:hypothetical protein